MDKTESFSKLPVHYSGRFKGSFAYLTIKDRLPVILVKVLDTLCQEKKTLTLVKGEASMEDIKKVIGRLSALQNEMITNKPIKPLASEGPDVSLWNAYLEDQNAMHDFAAAWFDSSWLYVECYLYRRIREAFELSSLLQEYDPFHHQKLNTLLTALDDIEKLSHTLHQTILDLQNSKDLFSLFSQFLEISLWGNKCDLSLSAGKENVPSSFAVEDLKSKILVNDTQRLWNHLQNVNDGSKEVHIHIILDNAGFELFADFCFLHFLLSANLIQKVSIYPKVMPWFVSDTLEKDIECFIGTLKQCNRTNIVDMIKKWEAYLAEGTWKIENELFWTLPYDYSEMSSVDPKLYSKLSESNLLIFKGDLNYRKLTGDRQWEETTPFTTALNKFLPTSLVSLRTVKADVVVGLPSGTSQNLNNVSPNWKFSGEYAVIQYQGKEEN